MTQHDILTKQLKRYQRHALNGLTTDGSQDENWEPLLNRLVPKEISEFFTVKSVGNKNGHFSKSYALGQQQLDFK